MENYLLDSLNNESYVTLHELFSGKGTQCKLIAKEFNYIHLSAGDLLREEVASGTQLGADIERYLREGTIVPAVTHFML